MCNTVHMIKNNNNLNGAENMKRMKRTIRVNSWDNWYGYEGTRKVRAFANSSIETQEQEAVRWVNGDDSAGHKMGE